MSCRVDLALAAVSPAQIFIKGRHIGGADDLFELDAAGKLDPLLEGIPKKVYDPSELIVGNIDSQGVRNRYVTGFILFLVGLVRARACG